MSPAARAGRVLQIMPEAGGGICRHVSTLCTRLVEAGWEVELAGPAFSLDRTRSFGLPPAVICRPLPPAWLGAAQPLRDALSLRRPGRAPYDLAHAHGYRAAAAGALSGRRPLVVTCHNLPPGSTVGRLLRSASAIVAVSPEVGTALRNLGVPADRVRVIPNGVDLQPPPGEETRLEARAALLRLAGHPGDSASPLILGVGRLSPEKGFDLLIRAFLAVRSHHPEAALVLVGDGPERPALEAIARAELPARVWFTGTVKDARSLLPGADLVVIPSRLEGQSLVALEAMAAGVPVVASDVGGLPSMVRPGKTGWLARPEDPDDLARAMEEALAAPPESMSGAIREMLEQEFDSDRLMERLLETYASALA